MKTRNPSFNVSFSPSVLARLDRLKDASDSTSRTETLRRALAVYEIINTVAKDGGEIIARYPDGGEQRFALL